ncbi:hypothetical protein [Protaetiibacter mangrovi]|uniref:Uncharacterized protein n=1 Tax=Protaetiibacter mangrovi TaxID=2970926 RepID=A0ABT1ZFF0_9MICO|nr:hypothetical protein [Protaetiibacter mangrovi]MCS0499430.1 hypothetical protein [Protaetiibacter mangrovi]TPX05201.1 hypothetical protein FJ656_07800 [Schumannella luteola]
MEQDDEIPPELAGYEPGEVGALRGPRMRRVTRIVVLVAVAALVLPGVLIGVSTASRTAALACQVVGSTSAPDAIFLEARWEWSGEEGPGWYCYATEFGGREIQLRFLGFIPEVKVVSPGVRV